MSASVCRSCGAEIAWGQFESGKKIPLDAMSVPDGNVVRVFDDATREFAVGPDGSTRLVRVVKRDETIDALEKRFVSHFSTCPNADKHRRSR